MDMDSVLAAYRRHAPYYDAVFGLLLGPGRQRTVRLVNDLRGPKVLEVGVGTGLSLPHYRSDLRLTGIDISPDMLRIARRRVTERGLANVDAIVEMDAEDLRFDDSSFDIVIAMYVASVVPSPARMVREIQRVCRPGGDIVIVNHFAEEGGLRGRVERKLAPLSKKLGWRPDFAIESVLSAGTLEVLNVDRAAPLGLFTILHCRNAKAANAEWQAPWPRALRAGNGAASAAPHGSS
jgi:phosphatidylethanolamine/phosphatidyl-N-methylethanolamine N-methyltransferase